jgi:hypothetical protein
MLADCWGTWRAGPTSLVSERAKARYVVVERDIDLHGLGYKILQILNLIKPVL